MWATRNHIASYPLYFVAPPRQPYLDAYYILTYSFIIIISLLAAFSRNILYTIER